MRVLRAGQGPDLRRAPDPEDPPVADGDGFGAGEGGVHRVDGPVDEDEVCHFLPPLEQAPDEEQP